MRRERTTGYVYHDACWQDFCRVRAARDKRARRVFSDPAVSAVDRRCAWCGNWIRTDAEAVR